MWTTSVAVQQLYFWEMGMEILVGFVCRHDQNPCTWWVFDNIVKTWKVSKHTIFRNKMYIRNIFFVWSLGRCGHNVGHRQNATHVCLYFFRMLCFLNNFIEFHDMRTECQIILTHSLLLISHKSAACANNAALFATAPRLISLCGMVWIKSIGLTWWCCWYMNRLGVTGDMI